MFARITFAALCGAAVTAISSLALRFTLFAGLFLMPGALIETLVFRRADTPQFILLSNMLLYSAIVLIVTRRFPESGYQSIRHLNLLFSLPVGALVFMACVPTLDPLWPVGMTQLDRREAQLNYVLPSGMDLGQAREALRAQRIVVSEAVQKSSAVVLERQDIRVTANAGDTVLSAVIPTDAWQFPCGHEIDLVLVFDKRQKLTQRSIRRFRLCP